MSREAGAQRTFLFSDIEGSTRLLTRLGDAYQEVHADYQRLLRTVWATHRGEEEGTEGDSFFVVFATPVDAARAAADAHRALAAHHWPPDAAVRIRIGLHTGQAVRVERSLLGLDVNRAARIAAAGHGGQTLLSDATHEGLVDALAGDREGGLSVRDLGRHRLKDVGVLRLWQLDVAGLPAGFGRLRTIEEHPTNLPGALAAFVDRADELDEVAAALAADAVVTLTGAGGIGKSRIAIEAARAALDGFPDGVFYLDAASLDGVDAVAERLLAILELEADPGLAPREAIVGQLRGQSVLLVLDNVDRVDEAAGLVGAIARAWASGRLLVTGRAPLRLGGEREVPIGPLALPPPSATGPGTSTESVLAAHLASPAVALFVARAREVRPDFELTEANAATVADICGRLDGLPLAIELAAARTRVLPVAALRDRLARRLPLLAGGPSDAPDRQQTMRAAIAWSYDLLDDRERALLDRLAVFEGPFELAGAEAVAREGETGDGPDPERLEALVERSLVARAGTADDEPAFRLLGTIREFALEQLEASGAAGDARDRHLRFLRAFVRSERARTDVDDLAVGRRVERLSADWEVALGRALSVPAPSPAVAADGIALAAALGPHWWQHGHRRDGLDWLERAVVAAGAEGTGGGTPAAPEAVVPAAPGDVADVLRWAGVLHEAVGDDERARQRLEAALERYVALGDRHGEARVLNSLGVVVRSMDEPDGARELLLRALALRRELGEESGLATTLTNLGIVEVDRGNHAAALAVLDEAFDLDRAAGVRIGMAYSGLARGSALAGIGRLDEAAPTLLDAIGTYGDLGDADGVCDTLDELGGVAARRGDARGAMRLFLAADALRAREVLRVRPVDHRRREAMVAPARVAVDGETLERMAAEARALDLPTAIALARAVIGAGGPTRWGEA